MVVNIFGIYPGGDTMFIKKSLINKKAFTLLEMLIVMVILSILFVVLVSRVDFSITESKEMSVHTDFLTYQLAIEEVCLEQKGIIGNMELLSEQLNVHLGEEFIMTGMGGSIVSARKDPWGSEYYFDYSRSGNDMGKLTVTCLGADKKFGTEDDLMMSVTYKNTPYGYKVVKESN
jgi:prepilin-type N-terminal cleavage/methylation domain-containing protein